MRSKATPWGTYKLQIDKKYEALVAVANLQAEQIDELFQAVDILLERNDYLKARVSVLTQEIKDKRHIPPTGGGAGKDFSGTRGTGSHRAHRT